MMYLFKNRRLYSSFAKVIFLLVAITVCTITIAEVPCNPARLIEDSEGARYHYDGTGEYKHLRKVTHGNYIATFHYHQNGWADKVIIIYPINDNNLAGKYEVKFTHTATGKLTAIDTIASKGSPAECPDANQYNGNITLHYDDQGRISTSSSRIQEACSQKTELITMSSDIIDVRYNKNQFTGYSTKEYLNGEPSPLGDKAVFDIQKSSCGFAKKNLIGPLAVGGASIISRPAPLQQTVSFKPHHDLMQENPHQGVLIGTYSNSSCTRANQELEKDLELWSYFDTSYGTFDYSFLRLELCI